MYIDMVRRYESPILNYLYRLVGDHDTAEDLAQDTFAKAYQALERLDLDETQEARRRAWLYRIAHNSATDHLRRSRRLAWLPLDAFSGRGHPGPEARVVLAQPVSAALEALTADHREVLYLFAVAGLTAAEVGQTLGLSEAAARKRLQRARRAFEEAYAPDGD